MPEFGKKGQIFSADALLGMIVFLFALSIVFYYFGQISERDRAFTESFEMKTIAFNSLSSLVETKGAPENWEFAEIQDAKSFGVSSERNVLSPEKLEKFGEFTLQDANSVRKTLGLGKYDFSFKISDFNGIEVFLASSSNSSKSVSFKTSRISLYNGSPAIVSLEVFK
ncbi:MAG: hypothetical protein Q7R70_01815 [Candidatus Diapherotrites archaeon]|nr:hypothetical protein [Candidatus Diapherotrites archaeon]